MLYAKQHFWQRSPSYLDQYHQPSTFSLSPSCDLVNSYLFAAGVAQHGEANLLACCCSSSKC